MPKDPYDGRATPGGTAKLTPGKDPYGGSATPYGEAMTMAGAPQQSRRTPAEYQGGVVERTDPGWREFRQRDTGPQRGEGLRDPIGRVYIGGGTQDYRTTRNMYRAGIGAGAGLTDYGTGLAGDAAGYAGADRDAAYGLYDEGRGIGRGGIDAQNMALRNMEDQARVRTPSLAQAQLRMAQDDNTRRMMGMAAATRGGNQAAAMRNAQAMGSQNALITNQQAAQLRAQEEATRQQNILLAQQFAAGAYGQQAGLGYNVAGQGLNAAQQSTGQMGQIGTNLAGTGVQQQGQYLDALGEMDKAQAELELEREKDKRKIREDTYQGIMGSVGGFGKSLLGAI